MAVSAQLLIMRIVIPKILFIPRTDFDFKLLVINIFKVFMATEREDSLRQLHMLLPGLFSMLLAEQHATSLFKHAYTKLLEAYIL